MTNAHFASVAYLREMYGKDHNEHQAAFRPLYRRTVARPSASGESPLNFGHRWGHRDFSCECSDFVKDRFMVEGPGVHRSVLISHECAIFKRFCAASLDARSRCATLDRNVGGVCEQQYVGRLRARSSSRSDGIHMGLNS